MIDVFEEYDPLKSGKYTEAEIKGLAIALSVLRGFDPTRLVYRPRSPGEEVRLGGPRPAQYEHWMLMRREVVAAIRQEEVLTLLNNFNITKARDLKVQVYKGTTQCKCGGLSTRDDDWCCTRCLGQIDHGR